MPEVDGGTVANTASGERKSLEARTGDRNISLSYCVGLPAKHDPASEDKAVRENGLTFLEKMAEGIGEMGGGSLGGIIYSCWPASMLEGVTDRRS